MEKNMDDRLEKLIESKTWNELTTEEKKFVIQEVGSEDQFQSMKNISLALIGDTKSVVSPNPKILTSLRKKFRAQHVPLSLLDHVLFFKMPVYAAVLIFLVIGICGWYVGKKSVALTQISEIKQVKKDTVYIVSKPDTIFVNKVIYRTIYETQKNQSGISVVNHANESPQKNNNVGVNMKEKEELDNFLVSGSE